MWNNILFGIQRDWNITNYWKTSEKYRKSNAADGRGETTLSPAKNNIGMCTVGKIKKKNWNRNEKAAFHTQRNRDIICWFGRSTMGRGQCVWKTWKAKRTKKLLKHAENAWQPKGMFLLIRRFLHYFSLFVYSVFFFDHYLHSLFEFAARLCFFCI